MSTPKSAMFARHIKFMAWAVGAVFAAITVAFIVQTVTKTAQTVFAISTHNPDSWKQHHHK